MIFSILLYTKELKTGRAGAEVRFFASACRFSLFLFEK